MKSSSTATVELLNYKVDSLERRIEQLEASREAREKELISMLIKVLGKGDARGTGTVAELPEPKTCDSKNKIKHESFSLIPTGRRRTLL